MKLLLVLALALVASVSATSSGCARQRLRLRSHLLALHKKAARCGDEDAQCVTRVFNKIASVRRRMASLRGAACKNGRIGASEVKHAIKNCHISFKRYMAARRARINRMAQKCGDEDDSCIQTSMDLLVALNKDKRRQHRLWKQHCVLHQDGATSPELDMDMAAEVPNPLKSHYDGHGHVSREEIRRWKARYNKVVGKDMPEEHWIPMSVWTHEFVCSRIRGGFKRWLKSQVSRRDLFHRDAAKCRHSDLACLRMNFQSIIHIQRHIHRGRSLYIERMATCDRCAQVKVKWMRWYLRQRARRHQLQIEACRCDENDSVCMQEKVDEIKKIQEHMRERRKIAFLLHGTCHLSELHKASAAPTTVGPETEIPDL